jgi:hypothetical protein
MGKIYVIFIWTLHERRGILLPALKGNNSCKTYIFRIKVRNKKMVSCFLFFQQWLDLRSTYSQNFPSNWLQTLPVYLFKTQTLPVHLFKTQTLPVHLFKTQTLPVHLFKTQIWHSKHLSNPYLLDHKHVLWCV